MDTRRMGTRIMEARISASAAAGVDTTVGGIMAAITVKTQ